MADQHAQRAMEISTGFLLDQVKVGRRLFDFVDALIIVGVTQANVELLMRDPDLQRAYATYDAPPPDSLRRPISINALAQSLGLPFETVRRRITRLALLGIVKTSADGVWTPTRQVMGNMHRRVAEAGYGRMQALYSQVRSLPELQDLPGAEPWVGPPPLRAAARLAADYLLRVADLLTTELGDPLDAVIWLEVLRSNTAEAGPRRPVRAAVVAKQLALPPETVRRRIAHLCAKGACEHAANGLLISEEVLARPEFVRIAARNLADLRRMFAGLAQLGALDVQPKLSLAA